MKDKNPLEIDIFNLHEEARKQAKLYKKWADRHANAIRRSGEAKSLVELTEAELRLKIFKRPGKYGLEKTTEKMIDAAVIVQPEYQSAIAAFHNAKHEADTLKGMVEATAQKKDMIQEEIKLHFGGYFAEPRVKGSVAELDKSVRRPLRGTKGKKRHAKHA